MSKSLCKVTLIGRLVKEIELRYSGAGTAVGNGTIVTNHMYKGEETAEFNRCVFFGKLAEIASEYLKKGDQCWLEGRLQTRSYEKDGITRYSTEIICNELILLGSKARPNQEQPKDYGAVEPKPEPAGDDGFDDIPF